MVRYPHFALPNVYLIDGYSDVRTEEGVARAYEREDELEQYIRRLRVRMPSRLRGWDLRFVRRGLGLSQAEFGRMVDRDAQTVARWEKSADVVPVFVDLTVRARFAQRFEPTLSVRDLLSYVDGTAPPLPEQIRLKLDGRGWSLAPELLACEPTFANALIQIDLQTRDAFRVVVSGFMQKETSTMAITESDRPRWLVPAASPKASNPIQLIAWNSSNANVTVQ